MEQLKYSYRFTAIKRITGLDELPMGTYVCVIHADKIPPHLGLVIDQKFFSLKTKGKDVDVPIDKLEQILSNKKVSSVFIKIDKSLNYNVVTNYFSALPNGLVKRQTCIHPLIQLLNPDEVCNTIADLLKYLEQENQISAVFGLHLSNDYLGIPDYDRRAVENRIKTLRNVERS